MYQEGKHKTKETAKIDLVTSRRNQLMANKENAREGDSIAV